MIDERLSAFLDGECDAGECDLAIAALARDPAQRLAWQRYLWAREALRSSDRVPAMDTGFADRVIAALSAESPVPRARNVVPLSGRRRAWWRPAAAGLAAAASIAAAVVLVDSPLRPQQNLPAPAGGFTVAAEDAAPIRVEQGQIERGQIERVAVRRRPADHWSVSDPAVEDQLNSYLIEHSGLARSYGLSGATPSFLRVATYGQGSAR